jgi:phosphate transport system substrate-binding protein
MAQMKLLIAAMIAAAGFAACASAGGVAGAGATFSYPVYAKWADAYRRAGGSTFNYQSIGSGGGIAQMNAGTVAFGASDMPLSPDELKRRGLVQFPTVVGGVVPVVNIPGVAAGRLVLSGEVLAAIYRGLIARWDDPAIRKLNPSLKLPNEAVAPVYRADGSGSTFIFTSYLSRHDRAWGKEIGVRPTVAWPEGIGAKGNEGVASIVMRTSGAVGYVEYAYVKQNRLAFARVVGRNGTAAVPGLAGFRAAMAGADWAGAAGKGFAVDLLDRPGVGAWPLTSPTYIMMRKHPRDRAETTAVLAFFRWAFAHGGGIAENLDYVPLPDAAVGPILRNFKEIQ